MSRLASISGKLPAKAAAVLDFWFGAAYRTSGGQAPIQPNFGLWFGGTPEIDQEIASKFLPDVESALRGEFDAEWLQDMHSSLALIVLMDQFALNVFRDSPKSFDTSAKAIPHAYHMVQKEWDLQLPEAMRLFVYLPLEHSESLVDQERCVELFKRSMELEQQTKKGDAEEGSMGSNLLGYAVEHRDVVKKYGRFPGRNAVHGRVNTPEEEEYLKNGGVF